MKRSIFLFSLILITGCGVRDFNSGLKTSGRGSSSHLSESVERIVEAEASLQPGSMVSITTESGSIKVTGGSTHSCKVTATITVRAKHQDQAQKLAEEINIRLMPTASGLEVSAERPEQMKDLYVRIDYEVSVPQQCHLECHSGYGSLSIEDIQGRVSGRSGSGGLRVHAIEGPLDLKTGYGVIRCEQATTGPVNLRMCKTISYRIIRSDLGWIGS